MLDFDFLALFKQLNGCLFRKLRNTVIGFIHEI